MLANPPDRLDMLLATAARVVPGLDGTIGDGRAWSLARVEDIVPMVRHLGALHPKAGAHYWALRAWGLHIWQPIYVGVIGTHLCRFAADLSALSQRVEAGCISGFRLVPHAPAHDSEEGSLARTARQLSEGWTRLFTEWRDVGPLPLKAAQRLLADCVLDALLAVQRHRSDWDESRMHAAGRYWLDALDLAGESGFLTYHDQAGAARMALDRKGCCLHYRRSDGEMCVTCPRQKLPERLARLAARDGP